MTALLHRISNWWSGSKRFKSAHVHIGPNGVLSKESDEILNSEEAIRQLDSFVRLAKKMSEKKPIDQAHGSDQKAEQEQLAL